MTKVTQSESPFEQFISETFDSEEGAAVALALRAYPAGIAMPHLVEYLEQNLGFRFDEPRRLTEKRLELRLRDLAARRIVRQSDRGFLYSADTSTERLMAELAVQFDTRRAELNRIIYSTTTKARRLAEAFRL